MIVDFRLPFLGDGINSADVIKVPVKSGDKIEIDQVVVEIETDKATVEVPSDVAGIVKEVYVKEGSKANAGEPLISVEVAQIQTTSEKQEERSENVEAEKSITATETKPIESKVASDKSLITNHIIFDQALQFIYRKEPWVCSTIILKSEFTELTHFGITCCSEFLRIP